jgi:hypothetical protein
MLGNSSIHKCEAKSKQLFDLASFHLTQITQ